MNQPEPLPLKFYPDDPDFLRKMVNLGIYGYSARECANMLDIPDQHYARFEREYNDTTHPVRLAWQKGGDKRTLQLEQAIMAQAVKGNMDAIREIESRVEAREIKNKKA